MPEHPEAGAFNCTPTGLWYTPNRVPLNLSWKPPSWGGTTNVQSASVSEVLDDIDLLLTGGRLDPANRALLEQVYSNAHAGSDPDDNALIAVLQHYAALPEFHITNNLVSSSSTTETRPVPNITVPPTPPPVEGYKAIVYLFMGGAADSFSMLAPMSGCAPLHDQYMNVRGDVAIQSSVLLPIDASTSNQPCNSFGLHPSLGNIAALYDQGDAVSSSNEFIWKVPVDEHTSNQ